MTGILPPVGSVGQTLLLSEAFLKLQVDFLPPKHFGI